MKHIFQIMFLLMAFSLFSCQQPTKSEEQQTELIKAQSINNKLHFTTEKQEKSYVNEELEGDNNTSFISFTYPHFTTGGNKAIRDTLNTFITNHLSMSESYNRATPEESMEAFIQSYKDAYVKTKLSAPYQAATHIEVINNDEAMLSLEFNYYEFTGGVHGIQYVIYRNFDPATGTIITLEELIPAHNRELLLQKAEQYFRDSRNLGNNDDLKSAGYWFDDSKFRLPNNFTFEKGNLVFLYNPYEIAPYSEGKIVFFIPEYELQEILK
ncbi:DUF3298 and DUF4163 domain-containing protein [Limibacter armeniacum]|uniref:DUF3298 and DUF4163 domain-containing protein n=1 Tax=Limibacter armeniacum TaxID=466084 RepID=UPI002FE69A08